MNKIELNNIDINKIEEKFEDMEKLILKLNECISFEQCFSVVEEINKIRDIYLTEYWISYIGYLLNVKDEGFLKTEEFFATAAPKMENLKLKYFKAVLNSKFKDQLEKRIGSRLFVIAENEIALINEETNSLRTKEKQIVSKYTKLLASSMVVFNGKKMKLSALAPHLISEDRELRKKAFDTRYKWFIDNEDVIDEILDKLVKVRTKIANKLGFDSYTEVGYIKMNRIGYDKKDISNFKKQIVKFINPIVIELKQMQKERLGYDEIKYYDDAVLFKDGNAKIKDNLDEIILKAKKMYGEASEELSEIFNFLIDNKFIDFEMRKNKSGGGITTYLPKYKSPLIVGNFDGTNHIIDLLSHEFGHAVQLYLSKDLLFHENRWPTFDICEIHSTSLEYLIYPWLKLFFEGDEVKYKIEHMTKHLKLFGYIAAIDEFQHVIYDKPELTKDERKSKWKDIQKEYMPYISDNHEYFEKGIMWQKQGHIFSNPFYYIDYGLATVCALSFYEKSKVDKENVWSDYINFCKLGGSLSLKELLSVSNLNNPFDEKGLENLSILMCNEIKELQEELYSRRKQ